MRACPKPIKNAERYIKNQIYSVPETCDGFIFFSKNEKLPMIAQHGKDLLRFYFCS